MKEVRERLEEFYVGCKDFVTEELRVTDDGGLEVDSVVYELSPRAKSQLCSHAGCTGRFFDLLSDKGLASVVSQVLPSVEWLVRTRNTTVRALLTTRYKVFDHRDLLEVALPALDVSRAMFNFSTPYWVTLTDDLAVLEVKGEPDAFKDVQFLPFLLLLNSETGVGAITVGLRLRLSTGSVFMRLQRITHLSKGRQISVNDALADMLELAPLLERRSKELTMRLRPIDRRFFVVKYGKAITEQLWGTFDTVVTREASELLRVASDDRLEVKTRLQLQEDLFKLLAVPERYIRDGWLIAWP